MATSTINDLATNPASGNVFLSVSKGKGAEATPAIVRINEAGNLNEISLKKSHSKKSFCRTHLKTKRSRETIAK